MTFMSKFAAKYGLHISILVVKSDSGRLIVNGAQV